MVNDQPLFVSHTLQLNTSQIAPNMISLALMEGGSPHPCLFFEIKPGHAQSKTPLTERT